MKTQLVYDIDGVVRDLMGIIKERYKAPRPVTNWVWHHKGKTIFDLVREDYTVLVHAKPTKYCEVIKNEHRDEIIEFWSAQPEDWRPHTEKWIKKHFNKFKIKYFKHHEKFRSLYRKHDILLVEDYPMYKDYSKIILIDWPYNRHVNPKIRVKTKGHLKSLIQSYKK